MHSRSSVIFCHLEQFFQIYDSFASKTWNDCATSLLERYDLQRTDSRTQQRRLLLTFCVISKRIIPDSMVYNIVSMCNQMYFV
jgi:hypothetical protein